MLALFSVYVVMLSAILASGNAVASTIPVIDISPFAEGSGDARQNIATAVDHAFANFGFAVITGHGVDNAAFDEAYGSAKQFFHLPISEKRQFDLGKGYGYGGYLNKAETGGQLSGEKVNHSDGVESLTIRGLQHLPTNKKLCMSAAPPHFAQDMSDVPRADAVPCNPPHLLANIVGLHEKLFVLKSTMTEIVELALGIPRGDLNHAFQPQKGGLRFAYYPPLSRDQATIDYGAHADSGSMVFLRLDQDNPNGTEVLHNGTWLSVPNISGGIVVNLGTVLSRATGGRWHAAVHRATRAGRRERLSLVLGALVPRNDLVINCLPQVCGPQSAGSSHISVKEYLDARVRLQQPEKDPQDLDVVRFVDELA